MYTKAHVGGREERTMRRPPNMLLICVVHFKLVFYNFKNVIIIFNNTETWAAQTIVAGLITNNR